MTVPEQYEAAVAKLTRLDRRLERLRADRLKLSGELDGLRRDHRVACPCGAQNRVGDIELIREEYNGRIDYNDNWVCQTREYFACPSCGDAFNAPKGEPYLDGFGKYVRAVHVWDSDRERAHGRVLELMSPWWDKQKKIEAEERKAREIKAAKKLLRSAGEMP
jgi:hypothetical protein